MTRKVIPTKSSSFFLILVLLATLPRCGSISDVGSVSKTPTASPTPTAVGWTGFIQKGLASKSTYGFGTAIDSLGNVFVVGSTTGNLTTNTGSSTGFQDIYLVKYNSSGTQQWIKQVGVASKTSWGYGVALDAAGNTYVSGYSNGNLASGSGSATGTQDAVLIKFNPSGVQQWIQQIGVAGYSTQVRGVGVAIDSFSNVYLAGYTTGNLVTGSGAATGGNDYYIIKFNSSGSQQWVRQVGVSSYSTLLYGINVDRSGNILLAGYTQANLVAGAGAAMGSFDLFIAKYTPSGTLEWTKQRGVTGQSVLLRGSAVDSSGNIYVVGQTGANLVTGSGAAPSGSNLDLFLLKYDTSGNLLWATQQGVSTKTTIAWCTSVDSSDNVYIGGQTSGNLVTLSGNSTGTNDYFLIKFNSAGTQQWVREVGVAGYSAVSEYLATDSAGNIIMTGNTSGNLIAGSGAATGSDDMWVLEYTSDGVLK